MHETVFDKGALHPAIAASCAIPAVFMPVKIGGRVMIDGGIYNPIPFDHLRSLADIVIAVDVVGGPDGDGETMPTRIDSLFGATQLLMQSIIAMKLKAGAPDILLAPRRQPLPRAGFPARRRCACCHGKHSRRTEAGAGGCDRGAAEGLSAGRRLPVRMAMWHPLCCRPDHSSPAVG